MSKEAVAAITQLSLSLKRAVASPPSQVISRARSLSWGIDDSLAQPRILSPPWGVESKTTDDTRDWRWGAGQATSPRSTASSTTAGPGVVNNWSTAIPLPRLALLSGLTTLRLNVSLAGVQARIPSTGLLDNDHDDRNGGGVDDGTSQDNTARNGPSPQEGPPSASPRKAGAHVNSGARAERARRCIRRVARQLVDRIHPAATSAGYRQACRLFRDEMGALGYDRSVLTGVLQALLDSTARIRGPAGHASSAKDGQEAFQPHSGMPQSPPLAVAVGLQQETTALPEERDDVRELVEAGMAALPRLPVSDGGDACGGKAGVDQEPRLLDIASVEVGGCVREYDAHVRLACIHPKDYARAVAVLYLRKSREIIPPWGCLK